MLRFSSIAPASARGRGEAPTTVCLFFTIRSESVPDILSFTSQPLEMRRINIDEESYFNSDDEEDEDEGVAPSPHPGPLSTLPIISPPLSHFQPSARHNRQHVPSIPLRSSLGSIMQRTAAPSMPIHLPWTLPINALVKYSDYDEQSSDPEDVLLESLVLPKPPPLPLLPPPPPSLLVLALGVGSGGFVLLHAEKRRRTEDNEDEMGLKRLVGSKTKCSTKTGTTGAGEETPKRIQLRFGVASLAAASSMLPTAACSRLGAKDGDMG